MSTLKVFYEKTAKRVEIPKTFSLLCNEMAKWIPIPDISYYLFKDQTTQDEVYNEETYQILIEKKKKDNLIKLNLIIKQVASKEANPEIKENMKPIEIKPQSQPQFPSQPQIQQEKQMPVILQEDSENKLKETIANLVKSKLKDLEESIISEICENINEASISKVLLSQQQLPQQKQSAISNVVHKGIQCSNCGLQDIKGVRFKCSTCHNYNLCSSCEENSNHDLNHIMIKIRCPDTNINKTLHQIKYVTEGLNFAYSPCYISSRQGNELKQLVKVINTGLIYWPVNTQFKCCGKESDVIGEPFVLKVKTLPQGDFNIEITFDIRNKKPGQYVSYWQMFTPKDIPFGEVAKFKIEIS